MRLTKKRVLLSKIETTSGTDSVPLIDNAILCGDIQLNGIEAAFTKRKILRPWLGTPGQVLANAKASVKFGVEAAGSGAAGTAPAYAALLRACGLAQTLTTSTKAEYKPVSAAFESVTIYGYDDGLLYKLLGARGTVELAMAVGDVPMFNFDFQGLYGGTPTVTANPTGTLPTYTAPLAVNDTNSGLITIGSSTYVWQNCNVNLANAMQHTPLIGRESVEITDREPMIKVVLEASATEERALIALVESGALQAFQVVHGTTAGNIVQVDGPKIQLTNPTRQEVDGQMLIAFDLVATPNAGNDELVITIK
jgi:hypothetical protein